MIGSKASYTSAGVSLVSGRKLYYLALACLLLVGCKDSGDQPERTASEWEAAGPNLERLPVPGGWIYHVQETLSRRAGYVYVPLAVAYVPTAAPKPSPTRCWSPVMGNMCGGAE